MKKTQPGTDPQHAPASRGCRRRWQERRSGSPWENGYNESFNGKLSDELLNLEIFYSLKEVAIGRFVDFYNYRRYHRALRDITPADMLAGRREEILGRRGEVKDRTINKRKLSNHVLREHLTTA